MASRTDVLQKVVKIAQELLLDQPDRSMVTPASIAEVIARVLAMNPGWGVGLDRTAVQDELIRRFSLWIGRDTTLHDDLGHVHWLNTSRKEGWRYWPRYQEWLDRRMSFAAVEALDRTSDRILGLLEDPVRGGNWDRRGLVVGHVQSGKTGNYTGVICKAADAGYKIIVVLAGLHNNLRAQTQIRLDEGFLGYETNPQVDDRRIVGVGEIDGDPRISPNFATNRSERGDFSTAVARHLGITPEQRPWLFVVKKNKTVLNRLLSWIRNHVADTVDLDTGLKTVSRLPLLLIDDEADHASVDTGEQVFDSDGNPDPEHQPTAINSLIRQVLHTFSRSAYVGYTATPFANIFIHERGETAREGPDLFPGSFIMTLGAPSSYVGPAAVFGLKAAEQRDEGLPLIRKLSDYADETGQGGWMPQGHRNGHLPLHRGTDNLPPSLVTAIDAFLLSCATRNLRGQGDQHASMLVHVTRFTSVQRAVGQQVRRHVDQMRQRITRRIDDQAIMGRLRTLWKSDFIPTSGRVRETVDDLCQAAVPDTAAVLEEASRVVADLEVRIINGTAGDVLDYSARERSGLKVIAIGGDKLARGLTLEGLSVSYFLRASRMYDTLMQMGRWFGYRPGYLDVCRLYTTDELVEWFGHIADASEELRQEFDLMAESGGTPRDYGLKVQSHPVLMVTSRLKMRTARNLMLSFSGQILETVALHRDPAVLQKNFEAARDFLLALSGPREDDPERIRDGSRRTWKGFLWNGVPAELVTQFLTRYRTHPAAYKVNGPLLAEFISAMAQGAELSEWTVALIGGGEGREEDIAPALRVKSLRRAPKGDQQDRYSIGRLLSPRDESIDLDEKAWLAALASTRSAWRGDPGRLQTDREPGEPNGPSIRMVRGFGAPGVPGHPERGLLMIYLLDPEEAGLPPSTAAVVAFGVSFPGSHAGKKVEYKVNNVLWEQEYGPAD